MSHMTDHSQSSATGWQEENALWYLGGQRIIQALEMHRQHIGLIFEYQEPTGTITSSYAPSQEDTAFYMIEGKARFVSGETTIHATPGTFLFLPRPLGFHSTVISPNHIRLLRWTTPLGFAQQVMSTGTAGQAFVLSPPPVPEYEKIQEFAALLRRFSPPVPDLPPARNRE